MKGLQGIVIAVALGVVGAVCNWLYIQRKAQVYDKVEFVMISADATVSAGDRIAEEDLAPLAIPGPAVGNLKSVAVSWNDKSVLIGRIATRSYAGGQLVLLDQMSHPGTKDFSGLLQKDHVARSVPIDSRSFVPEKVNPGNLVRFEIPTAGKNVPGPGGKLGTEVFGPFKVLALGTRTGTVETQRAYGVSAGPQHIITIGVKYPLDPEVARMFDLLRLTGGSGVQLLIHSDDYKPEGAGS